MNSLIFYKEHIGYVKFWPKLTVFEKITKNMFLPLFIQNMLEIDKILKINFELLYVSLKVAFSHFCEFLLIFWNYMPNKVKNGKFGKKVEFFALFGMELKRSAKIRKSEKTQHSIRCFKSTQQFKINLKSFCKFLAHFEQIVAKTVFFLWFSQKLLSFGQNLTLPMCSLWNSPSGNVYFYVFLWIG